MLHNFVFTLPTVAIVGIRLEVLLNFGGHKDHKKQHVYNSRAMNTASTTSVLHARPRDLVHEIKYKHYCTIAVAS